MHVFRRELVPEESGTSRSNGGALERFSGVDMTSRKPRLFYYEEAVSGWVLAPDRLENIIDVNSDFCSEEDPVVAISFRRYDMTDEEIDALDEG